MSLTLNFRHILACLRPIQPYSFLVGHIKNPSILRIILLLPQLGIRLFRTPGYLGTLCLRHIKNVRHIEAYLPAFGYILADSSIFRVLAQLDIFMYIKAYSKTIAYSVIFWTIYIKPVSGTSQEQFMNILNLNWADWDISISITVVYLST